LSGVTGGLYKAPPKLLTENFFVFSPILLQVATSISQNKKVINPF